MRKFIQKTQDMILLSIGAALFALSYVCFFNGNQITPGGLAGLGVILSGYTGLSVGILNALLNLPGLFLALRMLGFGRIARTIYAVALFSLFTELGLRFLPLLTENLIWALLLGGIIQGLGIGMLLRAKGSSGGTSLLGLLVELKFPKLRLATILLIMDGSVVLLNILAFGNLLLGLASLGAVIVTTLVIDQIIMPDGLWSRFCQLCRGRGKPAIPPNAAAAILPAAIVPSAPLGADV